MTKPISGSFDDQGNKCWYDEEGRYHREGGLPAIEWHDGTKDWCIHGQLHRDNDLPAREYISGSKVWCRFGKFHRKNGPAVIVYGLQDWYLDGKLFYSAAGKRPDNWDMLVAEYEIRQIIEE
jgi:hypothetical protein